MDYYPYGNTRLEEKTGAYTNDYKYTGKELDEESGLYYYGARYYNATIGRFTSQDPWGGDMTDPQSFNKYSYVRNNPLKYTDPTGKSWEEFRNLMTYHSYTSNNQIANFERNALNMEQNKSQSYLISPAQQNYINNRQNDLSFSKYNICLLCSNQSTINPNEVDVNNLSNDELIGNREAIKNNSEAGMMGVAGLTGGIGKINGASLSTNGLKLQKQLAREAQMGEIGKPIIEFPDLGDAGRLAKTYGGNVSDWIKKTSSSYTAKDGTKLQTHWHENTANGRRVEYKAK